MPCTCRMVTPYSSPPSTNVRNCSAPDDGSLVATWFMLVRPYSSSCPPDESGQIENQCHRAVAQIRGVVHSFDVAVVRFVTLDVDLLLAVVVVDDEADAPAVALDDDDEPLMQ